MSPAPSQVAPELRDTSCCVLISSTTLPGFLVETLEHAARSGLRIVTVVVPPSPFAVRHASRALLRRLERLPASERTSPVSITDWESSADWRAVLAQPETDLLLDLRGPAAPLDDVPRDVAVLTYDFMSDPGTGWIGVGLHEWLRGADDVPIRLVYRDASGATAGYAAAGRAKIHPHSYAATREHALAMSVHLLPLAVRVLRGGQVPTAEREQPPRRSAAPPSAARVRATMTRRKLVRLAWRLRSKKWSVGFTPMIDLHQQGTAALKLCERVSTPPEYAFFADPTAADSQTILCEALDARSREGRLVWIRGGRVTDLDTASIGDRHLSYPHVVADGEDRYLLPEMSYVGPQQLFRFDADDPRVGEGVPLAGLEELRLVDATLLRQDDRWWLFAGVGLDGTDHDTLFLWHATDVTGPYQAHPGNPIVRDPARARMAGPVIRDGHRLLRLGQDNRDRYGDGITVAEITRIDPEAYEETPRLRLRVRGHRGPHTLERIDGRFVIDYFDEPFSAKDTWQRLRAVVAAKWPPRR
jgi:hypothetical protein